jgi:hypothetical protein
MGQDRTRSPLLGEHAEEVLEQPGCSAEQIPDDRFAFIVGVQVQQLLEGGREVTSLPLPTAVSASWLPLQMMELRFR